MLRAIRALMLYRDVGLLMLAETMLLNTRLAPPRLHRLTLPRPALVTRLREALDHRLTLVHASTGYGKTTALAALSADPTPLFWYSIEEGDTEPQRFLAYLIAAFRRHLPTLSDLPLALLHESSSDHSSATRLRVLDALINTLHETLQRPSLFVLDDYHFVADSVEIAALTERLIAYAPPDLHIILATRYPINYPELLRWRARGEVLELSRKSLAFQPAEIEALFRDTYGRQLAPEELAALIDKTEGWPIALQLVWQGLRTGTLRSVIDLLADGPSSLVALFDYLAHDVLGRLPADLASFLCETAVLRKLTPAACQAVTGHADSAALLEHLHNLDLFVLAIGEQHYRYHHLFHDFLRQQVASDTAATQERHRRAAQFFATGHDHEEAIYHWLAACAFPEAAATIAQAGEDMLRDGRLDTVAHWIDALPPAVLLEHPRLQTYLGDIYRLRSRFDQALSWYRQAEHTWRSHGDLAGVSRALRGQARVYLDQVRPAQAESLLQEALSLNEGLADLQSRIRLLELLAENKLNMGKPAEAEALRNQARALSDHEQGEDLLSVRVKLRTGQFEAARTILETWVNQERQAIGRGEVYSPRGHRETVLILSLIHSFCGRVAEAFALAQEGIALGERLASPFITAVAQTRLAHALQIQSATPLPPQPIKVCVAAIQRYQESIALGDQLSVRRIRAEAMWGQTRAYGFAGDLEAARRAAHEGMEISLWAGDQWVAALTELTLGASYVLAMRPAEAVDILSRALTTLHNCGDQFGPAAARLWLSLAYRDLKQPERAIACFEELLAIAMAHQYDFLLTTPTLLGPPDPRQIVPLLISARTRRTYAAYASRLLAAMGLPDVQVHPGYQLRVQTLGTFRVWRGNVELEAREWQRDKARQLFQLLLTRRGQWLQREEIIDRLWPQLGPEAANRDFKVALNALNKALEPQRNADEPFGFIARDGTAYRLRPAADLWLDSAVFEQACDEGLRLTDDSDLAAVIVALRYALQLYSGDYLPDALYEDWAIEERERLSALYLRAADRLAVALLKSEQYDEVIDVCQRILARDSCWERAYQLLMLAHARLGNRSLALRTYQRCVATLDTELGVAPSPPTLALYDQIRHAEATEGL